MHISIDKYAGFCSGVKRAIRLAEKELAGSGTLYCLGQIVHNEEEERRLQAMGLKVIDHAVLKSLHDTKVLIRAHGEPPETYRIAAQNNITLIEGSCPVVLALQQKIKRAQEEGRSRDVQVVIYGRQDHPEVRGLNGQIGNAAVIVENLQDIEKIDFDKPVSLFAQTTKNKVVYREIKNRIAERKALLFADEELHFTSTNSICRQVSNRDKNLREFASTNEVVIFIGGENSSNGKYLFDVCKSVNTRSYYVGNPEAIQAAWLENVEKIGITGATSTPEWLLKSVASRIASMNSHK